MSVLADLYKESLTLFKEIEDYEGFPKRHLDVVATEALNDEGIFSRMYTWIDDTLFRNKQKESQLGYFLLKHKPQMEYLYTCDEKHFPKMAIPIPAGMKATYEKTANIFEGTHFSKAIPDLYVKMEKVLEIVKHAMRNPKDERALMAFRDCYYPTINFLEKLNGVLHTALEKTFEVKERNILNISLVHDQFKNGRELKSTISAVYRMVRESHEDIDQYGGKISELFKDFNKVILNIKDNPSVFDKADLLLLKKIVVHDAQIWTLVGQFMQLSFEIAAKLTTALGKMVGDDPTDWRK